MVPCHDAYEQIYFKFSMMLNMTKLYSLIPVWMTLMFSQGHKVAEKLKLVQYKAVVKLHEATGMFVMVDYVREVTVKKSCKCGEYGSFEHLLFMFSVSNCQGTFSTL